MEGQDMMATANVTTLRRYTQELPCKLTQDEHIAKARALANVLDRISNQEAHEHGVKQALKAEMAALESQRDTLRTIVARGQESRTVDVIEQAHHDTGRAVRFRLDTNESLGERALTDEERQQHLPLENAAAEPAPAA